MLDERFGEIETGTIWIEDIVPGMARSLNKTISGSEIDIFAKLSGDNNPMHLCDIYARDSVFGGRIAHGMLTAGLISAVIGEQLPGHGAIYLKQNLVFRAPVRPGDLVEVVVTVASVELERRRVSLDCRCRVGDTVVLEGDALVLAPSRQQD